MDRAGAASAVPSASVRWSDEPRRPAMLCAARREIAPALARQAQSQRRELGHRPDERALVGRRGSAAADEPDPMSHAALSGGAEPPHSSAGPRGAADKAWPADDSAS